MGCKNTKIHPVGQASRENRLDNTGIDKEIIKQRITPKRRDYNHFITDRSKPLLIKQPGCKRPKEIDIINELRNEGFLSGPKIKSAGGLSYDLVDNTTVARPPARLAKLEITRPIRTEEEIKAKLEKAERRRKRKEEAMITKLKSGINNTEEAKKNILAKREKLNENVKHRMNQVELNQELKVKEMQEKNIKKAKHAKTVRLRKDINLDDLDPV